MISKSSPTSDAVRRIDASLGPARQSLRRVSMAAGLSAAGVFAVYTLMLIVEINRDGYGGNSIQIDFTAYWAAAKLALAGHPLDAFDPPTLTAAQELPPGAAGTDLRWLYTPAWLLVISPLGLLPFSSAFLIYSFISFAVFATATRPLATPVSGGPVLVLAAPAVIFSLMLGNISLLWTAGLLGALTALAHGRAAVAGCLIALLTVKPQLGLLIPLALIAGTHWRAFFWASGVSIAIAAAPTAVFGLDGWLAFLAAMESMWDHVRGNTVRYDWLVTWYATARLAGIGHEVAILLNTVVTVACGIAVFLVWRRPVSTDIKAATLCVAIPLATPYAYHYEMTLGLAAAIFLIRDGFGATRGARFWLLALWLGPLPGIATPITPAMYAPALLTATLALCVWRARSIALQPAK
jgi:hypothetical protein